MGKLVNKLTTSPQPSYFCKGVMYLKREQYPQALAQFARVVEINPANADAFNRMGFIHGMVGNLEKELASYKTAVDLEDDDPVFAYRLGELLHKKYGDTRQASLYFKKAHDLDPSNFRSFSMYGYTLMILKEYGNALDVCALMIERYPEHPYGYKLKGDCFKGMKRYQEAIDWYLKSRDVAEKEGAESELDFQAYWSIGDAYEKLKKTSEAIDAYKRALAIKPHDVNTLYTLQYLYRGQGKYEEAYAAVKEILRLQPNHAGAQRLVSYLQRNVADGKSK